MKPGKSDIVLVNATARNTESATIRLSVGDIDAVEVKPGFRPEKVTDNQQSQHWRDQYDVPILVYSGGNLVWNSHYEKVTS